MIETAELSALVGRHFSEDNLQERLELATEVAECFLTSLFGDRNSENYFGKDMAQCEKRIKKLQIISSRVKSRDSLVRKIEKRLQRGDTGTPESILQSFTDLAGVRAVFTTTADVRSAQKWIKEYFKIDEANSEDWLENMDEDEFGYLSVHEVIELDGAFFSCDAVQNALKMLRRGRLEREFIRKGFDTGFLDKFFVDGVLDVSAVQSLFAQLPVKLEIQLRSMLQHVWAELAHDTTYKENGVALPRDTRRKLNAIAAILETSDDLINGFVQTVYEYSPEKEKIILKKNI